MAESTNTHELNLGCALAVWAAVLLTGVVAGLHMGFGGWKFALRDGGQRNSAGGHAASGRASRARNESAAWCGGGGALRSTVLVPLAAFVIYALGVSKDWRMGLAGAAYVLVPTLLLAMKPRERPRWAARLRRRAPRLAARRISMDVPRCFPIRRR